MKSLTLLRHAKAGWDDPHQRDFDRTLDARGRRAAPRVGMYLKAEGFRFDIVILSPSVRTRDTLTLIEDGYGQSFKSKLDDRVYMASADSLLDVLHELPDTCSSVLLIGHNPGFEDLAVALIGSGPERLRSSLAATFPTAAVAEILFDVESWADIEAGSGRLLRYVRPSDLDRSLDGD